MLHIANDEPQGGGGLLDDSLPAEQPAGTEIMPVEWLALDPLNARSLHGVDAELEGLAASMNALGQLQPIIVRPDPDAEEGPKRYLVTIGSRRFRAAQILGWQHMTVVVFQFGEDDAIAISAAENMARKAMHPVDEWRAVSALMTEVGWTLERAARSLGVDPAVLPRLRQLGEMAPQVLDALRRGAMPPVHLLRAISTATHEAQRGALGAGTEPDGSLNWSRIAGVCRVTRIQRSYAIFDLGEGCKVTFTEDLFAEADDVDRFYTNEVDKFMRYQREEIEEALKRGKGRYRTADRHANDLVSDIIPHGWTRVFDDIPKRWVKGDTRAVLLILQVGGEGMGQVTEVLIQPRPGTVSGIRDEGGADASLVIPPPPVAPSLNKATLRLLASMKEDAIKERLLDLAKAEQATFLLHALLLSLLGSNVTIAGGRLHETRVGIAKALLTPKGEPRDEVSDRSVCNMAAAVIGSLSVFQAPEVVGHAGPAAEHVALLIGALAPRCDTIEVLKGASPAALEALAVEGRVNLGGSPTALRKRLAGNLPDWRPAAFLPAASTWTALANDGDGQ
jgi:ParB family transcriptional regulator, chromosome partitioning protein